jgi:hypothetical protein
MKRVPLLLFFAFFSLSVMPYTFAQKGKSSDDRFRLLPGKPYVYLDVDHIGPREPRDNSEPPIGLWLRLYNNCSEPIVVDTFGVPPNSPPTEIGVLDTVVANPEVKGEEDVRLDSGQNAIPAFPPQPGGVQGELRDQNSRSTSSDKEEHQQMPHGYMFPVSSSVTIRPGHSIYFSLPINHVGRNWHFAISFRFALSHNGPFREPDNSIAFFWDDLPEAYRNAHPADQALPNQNP